MTIHKRVDVFKFLNKPALRSNLLLHENQHRVLICFNCN